VSDILLLDNRLRRWLRVNSDKVETVVCLRWWSVGDCNVNRHNVGDLRGAVRILGFVVGRLGSAVEILGYTMRVLGPTVRCLGHIVGFDRLFSIILEADWLPAGKVQLLRARRWVPLLLNGSLRVLKLCLVRPLRVRLGRLRPRLL